MQNTTAQPGTTANDPVLPERSHVFDIGVTQKAYAIPGLEVGMDAYYKIATDLLDDDLPVRPGLRPDCLQLCERHQ